MASVEIEKVEFLSSHEEIDDFFTNSPHKLLPQIALVGRSNVGKSSLICHLFRKKNLARVSKVPGKTITLNFFKAGKTLFVDLPGYGFAKRSQAMKEKWSRHMQEFFTKNTKLCCIIFLLDMRRDPSEDDFAMQRWIDEAKIPTIYVLTKADKCSLKEREERRCAIIESLAPEKKASFVDYTIHAKEGRQELIHQLKTIIGT